MPEIIPGTPQWENICKQCGLCCLVKYVDDLGNIWLTNIRCDMLDPETGKCKCYSSDMNSREVGADNCRNHNGSALNYHTLFNDYVVPGCCAYVQKFGNRDLVKKCAKMPKIKLKDTVPESSVAPEDIKNHIIPGSDKYFRYNPAVNKHFHEFMKRVLGR